MQDLRFVGVHENGQHLLLADDEGNRFRVPLDEPLRGAARRERPRQGRLPVEVGAGLRPKEVQAMIRSGLTAEEVAERAGWPVEKVHRYEGPILAEREYVASLARQVRLRPRGGAHGTSSTLDARVTERMRSREIEPANAIWDSFRAATGNWSVVVLFSAGGRQRQAGWEFDPLARTVSATDDEARWLSEDEDVQTPGPIPAPHLQPTPRANPRGNPRSNPSPSQVYDVEAEGGVAAPQKRRRAEPVDLMAAMRERSSQRGRRRRSKAADAPGIERVPDEALPLEELAMTTAEAGDPPPAHERTVTRAPVARRGHADDDPGMLEEIFDEPLPLDDVEPVEAEPEPEATASEPEPAPTVMDEPVAIPEPVTQPAGENVDQPAIEPESEAVVPDVEVPADEKADDHAPVAAGQAKKARSRAASRKSGRPSVPSWDDIMFGRKTD